MNWVSTSERMPERGQMVPVWCNEDFHNCGNWDERRGWYLIDAPWPDELVSHWMPLPEPPQANKCEHEWIDAKNEVVVSGEVCLKCNAIRAASTPSWEGGRND